MGAVMGSGRRAPIDGGAIASGVGGRGSAGGFAVPCTDGRRRPGSEVLVNDFEGWMTVLPEGSGPQADPDLPRAQGPALVVFTLPYNYSSPLRRLSGEPGRFGPEPSLVPCGGGGEGGGWGGGVARGHTGARGALGPSTAQKLGLQPDPCGTAHGVVSVRGGG